SHRPLVPGLPRAGGGGVRAPPGRPRPPPAERPCTGEQRLAGGRLLPPEPSLRRARLRHPLGHRPTARLAAPPGPGRRRRAALLRAGDGAALPAPFGAARGRTAAALAE